MPSEPSMHLSRIVACKHSVSERSVISDLDRRFSLEEILQKFRASFVSVTPIHDSHNIQV